MCGQCYDGASNVSGIHAGTSGTQWAGRADSITAIYDTLEAVIATLKEIRENEKKAHIAAEAKGLLQNISDFEFVLAMWYCFDNI